MTYDELRNRMADDVLGSAPDHSARQRLANLSSSLNQFMRALRLTPASRVEYDLGERFPSRMRQFSAVLLEEGVKPQRLRDHRSSMKRWSELALAMKAESLGRVQSLGVALKTAMDEAGYSVSRLESETKVGAPTIFRWIRGGQPNSRSIPSIRRIESTLGLERDALVKLVPVRAFRRTVSRGAPCPFRERQAERVRDPYYLPVADVPEALRHEWRGLLLYKTETTAFLERQTKGEWRTRPAEQVKPSLRKWHCMPTDEVVAPTADKNFQLLRAVIGYARRAIAENKLPGATNAPASLAIFASVPVVQGYVNFLVARSGGKKHGGVASVLQFACSLVHPETGYLTQNPQFAAVLGLHSEAWSSHCSDVFKRLRRVAKGIAKDAQPSRDPWAPIRDLVALPLPIKPLLDALETARKDIDLLQEGSVSRAVAIRDLLLVRFLISNPLRVQNIRQMTYRDDGSGNLYQSADGSWRLTFPREAFKNIEGAAGDRPYDTKVDPAVYPLLNQWLFHEKAVIDPSNGPRVFVSARTPEDVWGEPGVAVRDFTQRYVKGSIGFGPHCLRHLVATTFLKQRPGQFQQVALLLHDQLDTVIQHYANLKPDDGMAHWHGVVATAGQVAA